MRKNTSLYYFSPRVILDRNVCKQLFWLLDKYENVKMLGGAILPIKTRLKSTKKIVESYVLFIVKYTRFVLMCFFLEIFALALAWQMLEF